MKTNLHRLATVVTLALLVLAPAAVLLAQEAASEETPEMEATLTGQLSGDEENGYTLAEQESGDEIQLQGSVDFASFVDSAVNVTGEWANDADGNRYFEVSNIEAVEAEKESSEG